MPKEEVTHLLMQIHKCGCHFPLRCHPVGLRYHRGFSETGQDGEQHHCTSLDLIMHAVCMCVCVRERERQSFSEYN